MSAIHRAMLVFGLLVPILGGGVSAVEKDLYGDALPPGAVARLGTTRLSHSKVIDAVAFSPDGKTLASWAVSLRFWDAATGRAIAPSPTPEWVKTSPVFLGSTEAVSPDGKLKASGELSGSISIT